ncbi:MAG: paraquat-inducible protein A [Pseudomonadales bacterium]
MSFAVGSAAAQGLAHCHVCLKLSSVELHRCPRCRAALHARIPQSLHETIALLITAAILFIPANVLPITVTDQLGNSINSTIIGGVLLLWKLGSYPVAAVIFIASIMVPLGKLLVMAYLCWSVGRGQRVSQRERSLLYKITEFVGRWSMIDVFVVTILVALVRLEGIISFHPGSAALAFAGLVMVTMVAAERFDQRLIWDHVDNQSE